MKFGFVHLAVARTAVANDSNWPATGGHERQLPGLEERQHEAEPSGSFRETRRTAEGRVRVFDLRA